jgi:hypothetical protein
VQGGKTDFIIPLRIDDLPNVETTIELSRLGIIDFSTGWAAALARLIEKLEKDAIPKDVRFHPGAVATWWRDFQQIQAEFVERKELCASNWFLLSDLPERIYRYLLSPRPKSKQKQLEMDVPHYIDDGWLYAFGMRPGVERRLKGLGYEIQEAQSFDRVEFLHQGIPAGHVSRRVTRNIFTRLLRRAWELRCLTAGLEEYRLANDQCCYWFQAGLLNDEKIFFREIDGRPSHRQMTGIKTLSPRDGQPRQRMWHFAIQAKLVHSPRSAFAIRSHLIFTEGGQLLKTDKAQHAARRTQGKGLYNDVWLGRLLAAMQFLQDPECDGFISVPCGDDVGFALKTTPLLFESPMGFDRTVLPKNPGSADQPGSEEDPDEEEGWDDGEDEDEDEDFDQDKREEDAQ